MKAWYMDPWPLKPTRHEIWSNWIGSTNFNNKNQGQIIGQDKEQYFSQFCITNDIALLATVVLLGWWYRESYNLVKLKKVSLPLTMAKTYYSTGICIPANSHALGMSLMPAGWKLRSHAGSRLRANFSRLIEKCELLPSCLTQFPKIC